MIRLARTSLSVLLLLAAVSAHAQGQVVLSAPPPPPEALPVEVQVDPSLAPAVQREEVCEAVSKELRAPIAAPGSTQPTQGKLSVVRTRDRWAELVWRDASGREVARALLLPADDSSTAQVIALLTGTLARNEVDELIAPPPAPAPVVVAPVVVAPVVAAPPVVEQSAAEPAAPPRLRRFTFGLETYVSTVAANRSWITVPSLMVGFKLTRWLKVGVSATGGGWGRDGSSGPRIFVTGAPFAEVSLNWGRFQPFGQAGVAVQQRWGGGLRSATGIAPFGGVGARFLIGSWFTVGVGGRATLVASDYFQVMDQLLPQRAVMLSAGLELTASF